MHPPSPSLEQRPEDQCPHCGQPVGDAWIVCAWCGDQIAAPAELATGATLSDARYQVLGVIGRGGFGITYDVGDTRLKRRVAVKELFPESAVRHGSMVLTPPHARAAFRASRDRFLREARVLARFTHPGIVRVYEVFEEHGTAYLVMERLGGRTLVDVLRARNEPFTEAEVLDVAGRVAAALRPVHAAGVLHRDVNPSNVMLTEHGRIVVIDFGLARDFDVDQTVGMTRVVTPGYAPLEQYRGEGRFGPSTDVYGLAATLYRLATGKVPVGAIERDGGAALPSPSRLNPAISKPVSDAILDGLELEPGHRPQDIDAFLARLRVRRLPEAPRSVLLGSVGAEPADLASVTDVPAATDLVDPGPAVPPSSPSPAASADAERPSQFATEHVGPAAAAAALPPPPLAPVPSTAGGSGRTEVDPDRTEVPPLRAPVAPLAGDLTRGTSARTAVGPSYGPPPTVAASPLAPVDRPLTAQAAMPGSPSGLPLAVGPQRAGRKKATVPAALVLIALASAAPVLVTAAVVAVVLPVLATIGDSVAHRLRAENDLRSGWAERHLSAGLLAPVRFLRNLVVAVVRTSPVIGVAAVLVAVWYALANTALPDGAVDVGLRLVGGATVGAILLTSCEGSSRFRTGLGLDELVVRAVPGGKTTERIVVGWLVAAIVVGAALWLQSSPWPLPAP